MGVVYLAVDTTLDRKVALKFLPPAGENTLESEDRLLREARAASSLNHPNICTVYEVGRHDGRPFIAMECLDGETLRHRVERGPVDADEVLAIATQLADALDGAHARGIIHRDLKPSNLFLTRRGDAKILDFGVAKMTRDIPGTDAATVADESKATSPGIAVGTVAYMAPEQARGERVDARTDLFSFGIVLYELATGRTPFPGTTAAVIFDGILNRPAEPPRHLNPEVPAALERVILRLLAKDSAARYQTARHLLDDLRAIVRARQRGDSDPGVAVHVGPSIAVLPFTNLSADAENEYFSDGITEEIMNSLGHVKGLRVTGRTSSFAFKGTAADVTEVGEKLKVSNVLTGSVRRAGDRLRITAQLVSVADGFQLWSERYDRQGDDVFTIQDEIAGMIAGRLAVALGQADPRESLVRRSTQNVEAHELYLKARYSLNQRGAGIVRALEYFQRALAADPAYALAYSGLAEAYGLLGFYGYRPQHEMMPIAREAATRALHVDPLLADGHATLGYIAYVFDWDVEAAKAAFRRALDLNPCSVTTLQRCGWLRGVVEGQIDEALAVTRRALELDPLSGLSHWFVGMILHTARRHAESEEYFRRALELEPALWLARRHLGFALLAQGRETDGTTVLEETVLASGREHWTLMELAEAYQRQGQPDRAAALCEELLARAPTTYVPPLALAEGCALLGRTDDAAQWVERAYQERDFLPILNYLREWRALRQLPAFRATMQRIDMPLAPDLQD